MLSGRLLVRITLLILIIALVLTGCQNQPKQTEVLPEGGNPVPTPRAGEDVGDEPGSQAAATPDETIRRYLRDSISATVAAQQNRINLRERYQAPGLMAQDLGGLVTEISVLTDRTKITQPQKTSANAHVDLDIRVTFADGDTDTRTCRYEINLHQAKNTAGQAVWYVHSPDTFPIFASCSPS